MSGELDEGRGGHKEGRGHACEGNILHLRLMEGLRS